MKRAVRFSKVAVDSDSEPDQEVQSKKCREEIIALPETQMILEECGMITMNKEAPTVTETTALGEEATVDLSVDQLEVPASVSSDKLSNMLDFLRVIWDDVDTKKVILKILAKAGELAMKSRLFGLKKKVYTYQTTMKEVLKRIGLNKKSETFSLTAFVKLCQDAKFYTIFTKECLTIQEFEIFIEAWEKITQEQSSSSLPTEITGTSSTTAVTAPVPAGVPELSKSTLFTEGTAGDLFLEEDLTQSTGLISQCIQKKVINIYI